MTTGRNGSLSSVALEGALFTYAARYGGRAVVFVSTLVLARVLDRADFGLVAVALLTISFLEVLQDLGVGPALIYARDEPATNDTAFWLSLMSATALFGATWIVAPWLGDFFDEPATVPLTRAIGLTFPITALGNIHATLLHKRLEFRKRLLPDLSRFVGKAVVSVVLALQGFGAWSLVVGQLSGTAIGVVAYWLAIPWRPSLRFDRMIARSMLGYGWSIVVLNGSSTLLNRADSLLVGRFFGTAMLGVYTLAFRISELLVKEFAQVTGQVLFPIYAQMQSDRVRLRDAVLRTVRLSALVSVPVALGLALLAEPLVRVCLTEKWIDAAPILAVLSMYMAARGFALTLGAVHKAAGRPEVLARLSLVQLAAVLPALWWAAEVGGSLTAVAWMQVATAWLFLLVRFGIVTQLLGVPILAWARALAPAFAGGGVMAASVSIALGAAESAWLQIAIGTTVGAATYSACAWWLADSEIRELLGRLRAINGTNQRPLADDM